MVDQPDISKLRSVFCNESVRTSEAIVSLAQSCEDGRHTLDALDTLVDSSLRTLTYKPQSTVDDWLEKAKNDHSKARMLVLIASTWELLFDDDDSAQSRKDQAKSHRDECISQDANYPPKLCQLLDKWVEGLSMVACDQ